LHLHTGLSSCSPLSDVLSKFLYIILILTCTLRPSHILQLIDHSLTTINHTVTVCTTTLKVIKQNVKTNTSLSSNI
jgi:hypothetical protein